MWRTTLVFMSSTKTLKTLNPKPEAQPNHVKGLGGCLGLSVFSSLGLSGFGFRV